MRTLYRLTATGKPKNCDEFFDPSSTLIEDRIILLQATCFDDAVAKGEKEARAYCKQTRFTNVYGQKVRLRYLNAHDVYEIFDDKPQAGSEIYSSTELVSSSVRDYAAVEIYLREDLSARGPQRYKFMPGRVLRKVLAMMRESSEERSSPNKRKR